jgi:competence protein ComEA
VNLSTTPLACPQATVDPLTVWPTFPSVDSVTESPPTEAARTRLAALIRELAPEANAGQATGRAGRLVERWLPGGTRSTDRLRTLLTQHRTAAVILIIALLAAIGIAITLSTQQPETEAPPLLPAAVSQAPTTAAPKTTTTLVISVVGKVMNPGLVTLPNGARVADALKAAGGPIPGTDDTTLNLARRLTDGEQIYVGIPTPAAENQLQGTPAPTDRKGGKAADPTTKINLNTATAAELQTLPGIGPTMSQRILSWRAQHGQFDSITQLKDVGGIGAAKFAKLEQLVTT